MKASLYDDKFTVITSSYIPENPISPNTTLTLAIGGVLAIFLGILGVFVKDASDKTVKDINEFESIFDTPNLILKNKNEVEKVFNYIYKNDFKKFGLLFLGDSFLAEDISKKLYNLLNNFNSSKIELFTSKDNEDHKESLVQFERFKNAQKAFIYFNDYYSSDYILYRDELEKILIFVEEKVSRLEDIEKILKRQEDPIIVYIKK